MYSTIDEKGGDHRDEKYIAKRLTRLRLKKNVSEYKMSMDMGHSSSYIHSIAAGKALPSMREFLYLCDYLEVTPRDFFDSENDKPQARHRLDKIAEELSEADITLLISLAERMRKK